MDELQLHECFTRKVDSDHVCAKLDTNRASRVLASASGFRVSASRLWETVRQAADAVGSSSKELWDEGRPVPAGLHQDHRL